ncbi:alpha/beta hydrolase [Methylobrevis sp. L22]|uniref:Alpha/beta hydrolase n=2 Tax=Methylobrevis albus TaxID=2793297 RepID=A0A931I2L0_9HYPH|nr:alpha/beta hydrolase [Methylobrevis albus]
MTATGHPFTFQNGANDIAAVLHVPNDFDEAGSFPAIVVGTPGSSVKEQIGANYASRLAARGFLALTFDPSFQGESGSTPRNLESPAARVEDIRCAADCLTTLPFVDAERLGLLGVCAGGGYAVEAALSDRRFKALGTVVGGNIGAALRRIFGREGVRDTLEAVGRQRAAEARGGAERQNPWIPDSVAEAEAAGIVDPELLSAIRFYREPPYRHPNSTNRLLFKSFGQLLSYDAFALVPELLTLPLQVIVAGTRGATGQYEDGETLYQRAPSAEKDFFVIEGAGHYDMYHVAEYLDRAIDQLVPFYTRHLGG